MCIRDRKWTSFPAFCQGGDSEQRPLDSSNLELDLAPVLLLRDEAELNLPQIGDTPTVRRK
eukprot:1088229-Alexandrium_andersonii.AAC.1